MGLVIVLGMCWWIPAYAPAILFLWLLLEDEPMACFGRGVSSVILSSRVYRTVVTSTPEQERLNTIARDYFVALYGGNDLSSKLKRLRTAVAVTLLLVAVGLIGIAAWDARTAASVPVHAVSKLPAVDNVRAKHVSGLSGLSLVSPVASLLVFFIVAISEKQRHLLARATGKQSRQEQREAYAYRVTAASGGPQKFVTDVKTAYGHIPELSAWFLAPYWVDTAWLVGFTILGMCFGIGVPTLWQTPELRGTLTAGLVLLDAILVGYLALLALMGTSRWQAVQVGEHYFPLQVFCRDLNEVERLDAKPGSPSDTP